MQPYYHLATISALAFAAAPTFAATFSDTDFDLTNYAVTTFQNSTATISITQTLTGGNPGSGLSVETLAPPASTSTFYSNSYFYRSSWAWNPSTDGVLNSVSWNLDVFVSAVPTLGSLSISGAIAIFQEGNIYVNYASVPAMPDIFQTASAHGLTEAAFSLVTNRTTGEYNSALHPNFSSPLNFGFIAGSYLLQGTPAEIVTFKADNLVIQATPVPEPMGTFLFLAGLPLIFLKGQRGRYLVARRSSCG